MNEEGKKKTTTKHHMIDNEPLWTVDDVASYLRLEVGTIRTMAKEGKIPGVKIGRIWRFRKNAIHTWIQEKSN